MVRHGKSSWEIPGLSDQARSLTSQGRKRTERIAAFILNRGVSPGLIVCSHAKRAFETAVILARCLNYPRHEILIESKVYNGTGDKLYELILALPDHHDSVMIVGHNPGITQLANSFLHQKADVLPTSSLVGVSFDASTWGEVPLAHRQVLFVIDPKSLNNP